jgi:signal transduction histidine kinase
VTAFELSRSGRPRLSDRAWLLTAAAGVIQLVALALALAGGSLTLVATLVAGAGALLGVCLLAPRALAAARRNRGLIVFAALVLGASAWFTARLTAFSAASPGPTGQAFAIGPSGYFGPPMSSPPLLGGVPLLPLAAMLLAVAAGLVLSADAVRVWLGFAPHQRAPWRELTDTQARSGGIAWRAAAGVLLVGVAAVLGIGLASRYAAGHRGIQTIVLLLVAAAAAVVIGMPVAIGSLMRVDRDKAGSARERERQRFAAHLHDSVLQTLALVQRQAHNPAAVARLARRQEHALRAWMAGEAELLSETLVAALRDAVATVEDEYGITVELTAIGDRPLDSAGEELVAAAREALRNAARYANGAPVFVFSETSDGGIGVFVRDEGPGFDPAAVPAERRGIRDAIVGRMASAGGLATIESAPGEGTEVALRISPHKAGR